MRLLEKCAGLSTAAVFLVFLVFLPYHTAVCSEQAVFKLILNEEDKGEFFFVLAPEGDIWMARSDFEQLGLKEGLGRDVQFNGITYVSMKSLSDLAYRINEEKVSLEVYASPSLFREYNVETSYARPYDAVTAGEGAAFLNYSVSCDHAEGESMIHISGELGISSGGYLGLNTFTYQKTQEREKAVRLITGIMHNNRDTLQTITLGDFSSFSGALGSDILLGGISYSKNFSLTPHFLTQPPLKISGTLETPSDVEIYLDGALVRKEKHSPGEFTFQNIPATTGFGSAKMVITDVHGREKIITTPYYYSHGLLKRGLQEYSYNAGFIRKDFGIEDFSYGRAAFMSVHNFGISNSLKIGYAAEASSELLNIGPAVSFPVHHAGIVNTAFAVSSHSGRAGFSGMLNYMYQSKHFNLGLFFRSDSRAYSTLALEPSDDRAKALFRGTIGFGGKRTGYMAFEYSHADMYEANRLSRISASYNRPLTRRASLFATASRTKDFETYDEIFFGIHVYLGRGISGSTSYAKKDDAGIQRLTVQKSPPPGDGFGLRADMVNADDADYMSGAASYQNSYGIYEFGMTGHERGMDYSISAAGGIGYIDKSMFISRPITDSFAKVKVPHLEDVRVYYYGNEVGRTDGNGELIVTNIRSYHDNKISIEGQDIPIDYSINSLSRYISPSFRNGSVVEFEINRIQAATGNLYIMRDEARVPIEFTRLSVQVKGVIVEGLVGRNGEFYLENLPHGRHPARTFYKGDECGFDIIIPESTEMFLHLGDIDCEKQR